MLDAVLQHLGVHASATDGDGLEGHGGPWLDSELSRMDFQRKQVRGGMAGDRVAGEGGGRRGGGGAFRFDWAQSKAIERGTGRVCVLMYGRDRTERVRV